MNNYAVIKTDKAIYCCVVIATSYISPMSTLEDLQAEIKTMTGNVLFDMTLINGTSSNRYISAKLVRGIFDKRSFKIVSNITDNILDITRNYYISHPNVVEAGVIPSSLKFILKNGQLV